MGLEFCADMMTDAASDFDLVVVGAGAAGLLGALRAAHGGARVALLERDSTVPSNLAISGGLFSAADTRWQAAAGVTDSPEIFAADIRRKTEDAVPASLLRLVTGRSADVAEFMADGLHLPILLSTTARFPGHSTLRLHTTPAESGEELSFLLRAAVQAHSGIAWMDGSEVVGLATEQDRVTGARLANGQVLRASWVLLACGGFGGSPELLRLHAPLAAEARHVGSPGSDGRGIGWAAALGAGLACMGAYQGQPHVCSDGGTGRAYRLGAALPALGAVMVNRQGQRFVNERMGPSELTAHILAQPDGVVEIWDAAAQQAASQQGPFRAAVAAGRVEHFEEITALGNRFGLPVASLAQVLADADIKAPVFAASITGGIAHTQGGVLVDDRARVLTADGAVVPGLLAGGGVACGVSGNGAAGYVPGNGLAQSFVLGMVAGETAASR
jgi:fumarate reductase flavoprotein subunit